MTEKFLKLCYCPVNQDYPIRHRYESGTLINIPKGYRSDQYVSDKCSACGGLYVVYNANYDGDKI